MSDAKTDHAHSEAIATAGQWLADEPRSRFNRPIVPLLRERFGLTAAEAIEAIREANLRQARAT